MNEEHNNRKIITDYWAKPIPTNKYDWEAVFDDYDGAEDSDCPIGHGATQAEAIQNLMMEAQIRESGDDQPLQTEARA